jgi:hypothetical protein
MTSKDVDAWLTVIESGRSGALGSCEWVHDHPVWRSSCEIFARPSAVGWTPGHHLGCRSVPRKERTRTARARCTRSNDDAAPMRAPLRLAVQDHRLGLTRRRCRPTRPSGNLCALLVGGERRTQKVRFANGASVTSIPNATRTLVRWASPSAFNAASGSRTRRSRSRPPRAGRSR